MTGRVVPCCLAEQDLNHAYEKEENHGEEHHFLAVENLLISYLHVGCKLLAKFM